MDQRRANRSKRRWLARAFLKVDLPELAAIFRFQANQYIGHPRHIQVAVVIDRCGSNPISVCLGKKRHRHCALPFGFPQLLACFPVQRSNHFRFFVLRLGDKNHIADDDRAGVAWPQIDMPLFFQPCQRTSRTQRLVFNHPVPLRPTPLSPILSRRFLLPSSIANCDDRYSRHGHNHEQDASRTITKKRVTDSCLHNFIL